MCRKKGFAVAILIFATSTSMAAAQPPDSLWSRTFGGSRNDRCYSVQPTTDGGYILAGWTRSYGSGYYDFWLVRTNANGDSVWSNTYGGDSSDACYSLEQTLDGGFVLGGATKSFGAGSYDFWLVKTDANGDSLWSRSFGGSGTDVCYSVRQTSDSGYILGGSTESFGNGSWLLPDFWLVKTNVNGDSLWSRTFGGNSRDMISFIQETSDGGYILAGRTSSFGAWEDFWIVKTDANGDNPWSRTFGGAGLEECYSVQQTFDGGFALAGITESFGVGSSDFWLVKTNANGDYLWSRTFGSILRDRCFSVCQTSDSGYILAGDTWSLVADHCDMWLVKVGENGDSLWSCTFGGSDLDECLSVTQTSDGGFILAGDTWSFGSGEADFWLVKTGPELSAEPPENLLPSEYMLYQNYPNPFNLITEIVYDVPKAGTISLKVFDILGREVASLMDGHNSVGSHRVALDGNDLASGIYFYRLQAGDFTATKKMVLLK